LERDRYVPANQEGFSDHPDAMADMYRELNGMAVIFDIDDETRTGLKASNEEIAQWVTRHPDVYIGFGSVDPWKGKAAIIEVERCAALGLKGIKFHPAVQDFAPNDPRFFPLWETCARLGLAVLFHSGTTMAGAGQPGGAGIRLEYGRPIPYIDDIAARFPELRIIMAHPAWPWHEEQLAILRHKPNVFMDLSGWAPKYIPESVIRYANSLVQDKVFFGSDFPCSLLTAGCASSLNSPSKTRSVRRSFATTRPASSVSRTPRRARPTSFGVERETHLNSRKVRTAANPETSPCFSEARPLRLLTTRDRGTGRAGLRSGTVAPKSSLASVRALAASAHARPRCPRCSDGRRPLRGEERSARGAAHGAGCLRSNSQPLR
jgi:predicted TIM-barrel fold metal-dependent hydrolase